MQNIGWTDNSSGQGEAYRSETDRPQKLNLYEYRTGDYIRELTPEESAEYLRISGGGACGGGAGAVAGHFFGQSSTVYAA